MTDAVAAAPTHDQVLDLLRSEIQDAEADRARQGLTTWVLAAAAAGLLWVGIGVWESQPLDVRAAARMVVVATVVIEALRAAIGVLGVGLAREGGKTASRVFIPPLLPLEYSRVAMPFLGKVLLLALTFYIAPGTQTWAMVCLIVPQMLSLIGGGAAISALLAWDLPVTMPPGPLVRRGAVVVGALATLVPIAGAAGAGLPLRFAAASTPLPEFRVALIVLALAYLLPMLTYVAVASPHLSRLRALRRDLLLGAVDAEVARRQVEVLLIGQELGTVLERYVRPMLDLLDEAEQAVSEARAAMAQLGHLQHDRSAADPGQRERLVGEACLAVLSAQTHVGEFSNKRRLLQRRLTMLRYMLRGPLPDFNAALDTVDRRAAELDLRAAQVEAKLRTAETAAGRLLVPAEAAEPTNGRVRTP